LGVKNKNLLIFVNCCQTDKTFADFPAEWNNWEY